MASKSHNFRQKKTRTGHQGSRIVPESFCLLFFETETSFRLSDHGSVHLKSQQKPLSSIINPIYTRCFIMLVPNFGEKQRLQNPIGFMVKLSSFPADFGDELQGTSANSRIESKMWRTFGARWDFQEKNIPSWSFQALCKTVGKLWSEHLPR